MSADLPEPDPAAPAPPDPLVADAAVAPAGEPHRPAHGHVHSAGNTHCLNCGTALQGPYCHACGQHDFDVNQSFWHTFLEALENLFHFEGKFFRNIVTLLFRPGVLTAEFNAGKRASQMPPFRLYIFTAFVFFLWIFSTDRRSDVVRLDAGAHRPATVAAAPARPANQPHVTLKPLEKPVAQMNEAERWVDRHLRRVAEPGFQRELSHAFLAAIPKLLLVCLPLFALYARVLYRRTGPLYLQHLIMALHFHTFIFLWTMCGDGWVFLASLPGWHLGRGLELAANLWFVAYPALMLRRLHGEGWLRTIAKTVALALAYCLTLAMVFIGGFVVLLLLM